MAKNTKTVNTAKSKLDYALEYIKQGFRLCPLFFVKANGQCECRKQNCKRNGKHPTNQNGVTGAAADEATVRAWWTESPRANIGLATGHNGLVVMDIDVGLDKNGSPKVGEESLAALEKRYGKLPKTRMVETGSGGRHYYFRSSQPITNSESKVAKDIDIRGMGGYVILPPSNHKSGGSYKWIGSATAKIAPMPEWLEKLCMGTKTNPDELLAKAKPDKNIERELDDEQLTGEEIIQMVNDFIPPDCDRDRWWKVGAILKKKLGDKEGYAAWDDWSRKSPDDYDAKIMPGHWNSFEDKGLTLGTLIHFAQEHPKFKWPERITAKGKARQAVQKVKEMGWVYCVASEEFYQADPFQKLSKRQFSDKYAYLKGKIRRAYADLCLDQVDFPRVDVYTFDPRTEARLITEDGLEKLNLYRPHIIIPKAGIVQPFLDHAEFILPDEEQRRILLQFMAFNILHPGVKIRWALILYGRKQRTGKSYFGQVLKRIIGPHNVSTPTNDRLHEPWTDWQEGAQLIIVEELMGFRRQELMNRFKPMITEDITSVRLPGGHSYEMPNRFNFMMFTNHKNALPFEETDKRYCALETKAERKSDAYYDGGDKGPGLWDWTWENLPAVKHYLTTEVSLDGFKANGEAPITDLFNEIVDRSGSELDEWIKEGIEGGLWLFSSDLVTVEHLLQTMPDYLARKGIKKNSMAAALEKVGAVRLSTRAQLGKLGYKRVWAIRDHANLAMLGEGTLGALYLNALKGTSNDAIQEVSEAVLNAKLAEHKKAAESLVGMVKEGEPM